MGWEETDAGLLPTVSNAAHSDKGDVRLWRVERGCWEAGMSGRATCRTSTKDSKKESKNNNLNSLPPVTYLGFPLGGHSGS